MKAKKVSETLGFERNLDPRESMGIGITKIVGRILYIPNSYVFSERNTFYKRYTDVPGVSKYEVVEAEQIDDDTIRAKMVYHYHGAKSYTPNTYFTLKQLRYFLKPK